MNHSLLSHGLGCGGANRLHISDQNELEIIRICDVIAEKNLLKVYGWKIWMWVRRAQQSFSLLTHAPKFIQTTKTLFLQQIHNIHDIWKDHFNQKHVIHKHPHTQSDWMKNEWVTKQNVHNFSCAWVRRDTPKPYIGASWCALLTHAWVRREFFVGGLGGPLTPVY